MKLIIDIPEDYYKAIKEIPVEQSTADMMIIQNGILLDQELCNDVISRQAAIDAIKHAQVNFNVESEIDFTKHKREVQEIIENVLGAQEKALKQLPPVTAEKVGQWIDIQYFKSDDTYYRPKCPFCNTEPKEYSNYCPNCGAKMQEVEE